MAPSSLDQVLSSSDREASLLDQLRLPLRHLPELTKSFDDVYHHLGLNASDQFLPTPITALPSGFETGRFLTMDMGGSNLRVAVVELYGSQTQLNGTASHGCHKGSNGRLRISTQGNWAIPEYLKSGASEIFFKWVAQRLAEIVQRYLALVPVPDAERFLREGLELGVTFSFPMEQSSHASALLMPMGKGFTFTTTNNLSDLLTNAYSTMLKTHPTSLPPLHVVAITNDSISTFLGTAYLHNGSATSRAAAGIIAGTGTNATCLCPVSKLAAQKRREGASVVLVNTEWSINGTLPPLVPFRTEWDKTVSRENVKPGFQPLEYMIGGRYLCEVVRLAAVDIFAVPKAELPRALRQPYGVETKLCADVEAARDMAQVQALLIKYFGELEAAFWTQARATTFLKICTAVSDRAAALVAAATVGVLAVNDDLSGVEEEIVVGYTGTVLERYPGFRERCEMYLDEIAGVGRVRLVESLDGGIVGAAVLAAMVKAGST